MKIWKAGKTGAQKEGQAESWVKGKSDNLEGEGKTAVQGAVDKVEGPDSQDQDHLVFGRGAGKENRHIIRVGSKEGKKPVHRIPLSSCHFGGGSYQNLVASLNLACRIRTTENYYLTCIVAKPRYGDGLAVWAVQKI